MKRMLINATQPEELRVAIADGQQLINLDIESPSQEQKKANIYKGRITRVEPSLEACFVDYGSERHGFLPLKEISPQYFRPGTKRHGRVNVRDAMEEGQEVIIQVDKEERGNKGAALTTYISLAGRYLVLMPNNPDGGGVSRRIMGDDRKAVRESLDQLNIPDKMSIIIRTAGVERAAEELQWDLDYLLQLWAAIEQAGQQRSAPFLIYQESNLIIRALRDYFRDDIGEILVDDDTIFNDAREFMQMVMPQNLRKLKPYTADIPLFSRFQIESQIESAFSREVRLPSGGALVIDHTEALLSIDINSARATKGSDIEETAYQTNLEAADEISRQLRLRDLGGLIVIDFIDMNDRGHQRSVEERMREAMREDRARVQLGRISRFGLLEMSRQRLRPSLGESSAITCPRCLGHGTIRSIESLALSMLRLIEEEAMKEFTGQVITHAPIEVANFLLNEKRENLLNIEERNKVPLLVVANPGFETPRFDIRRIRENETIEDPSYLLLSESDSLDEQQEAPTAVDVVKPKVEPAVQALRPSVPAPPAKIVKAGFFARIANWFSADADTKPAKKQEAKKPQQQKDGTKQSTTARTHHGDSAKKDSVGRRNRGKKPTNEQRGRQQRQDRRKDQQQDSKATARRNDAQQSERQTAANAQQAQPADRNINQETARQEQPQGKKAQGERRRGRRGGRRRRNAQNQGENQNVQNTANQNAVQPNQSSEQGHQTPPSTHAKPDTNRGANQAAAAVNEQSARPAHPANAGRPAQAQQNRRPHNEQPQQPDQTGGERRQRNKGLDPHPNAPTPQQLQASGAPMRTEPQRQEPQRRHPGAESQQGQQDHRRREPITEHGQHTFAGMGGPSPQQAQYGQQQTPRQQSPRAPQGRREQGMPDHQGAGQGHPNQFQPDNAQPSQRHPGQHNPGQRQPAQDSPGQRQHGANGPDQFNKGDSNQSAPNQGQGRRSRHPAMRQNKQTSPAHQGSSHQQVQRPTGPNANPNDAGDNVRQNREPQGSTPSGASQTEQQRQPATTRNQPAARGHQGGQRFRAQFNPEDIPNLEPPTGERPWAVPTAKQAPQERQSNADTQKIEAAKPPSATKTARSESAVDVSTQKPATKPAPSADQQKSAATPGQTTKADAEKPKKAETASQTSGTVANRTTAQAEKKTSELPVKDTSTPPATKKQADKATDGALPQNKKPQAVKRPEAPVAQPAGQQGLFVLTPQDAPKESKKPKQTDNKKETAPTDHVSKEGSQATTD